MEIIISISMHIIAIAFTLYIGYTIGRATNNNNNYE